MLSYQAAEFEDTMGTLLGWTGAYVAVAALFYLRLTATATSGYLPRTEKPSHWHRARRLTRSFLRRVRPSLPKH